MGARRGRVPALQHLHQQDIQSGGVRQVVATPAQQQIPHGGKATIAPVGQYRYQAADELPPVPQGRSSQVLQALGQFCILVVQLGVLDDGDGAEQLQGRFPEVEGGMVALLRRLSVVSAAIQLGQGQGQPPNQVFVARGNGVHSWIENWESRRFIARPGHKPGAA